MRRLHGFIVHGALRVSAVRVSSVPSAIFAVENLSSLYSVVKWPCPFHSEWPVVALLPLKNGSYVRAIPDAAALPYPLGTLFTKSASICVIWSRIHIAVLTTAGTRE